MLPAKLQYCNFDEKKLLINRTTECFLKLPFFSEVLEYPERSLYENSSYPFCDSNNLNNFSRKFRKMMHDDGFLEKMAELNRDPTGLGLPPGTRDECYRHLQCEADRRFHEIVEKEKRDIECRRIKKKRRKAPKFQNIAETSFMGMVSKLTPDPSLHDDAYSEDGSSHRYPASLSSMTDLRRPTEGVSACLFSRFADFISLLFSFRHDRIPFQFIVGFFPESGPPSDRTPTRRWWKLRRFIPLKIAMIWKPRIHIHLLHHPYRISPILVLSSTSIKQCHLLLRCFHVYQQFKRVSPVLARSKLNHLIVTFKTVDNPILFSDRIIRQQLWFLEMSRIFWPIFPFLLPTMSSLWWSRQLPPLSSHK